jgi:hypothetical protein
MLVLQAPGSLLVMYFLAILNKQDFTTWAPYLITFIQQSILIGQCLYYRFKKPDAKSSDMSEITPLVKDN